MTPLQRATAVWAENVQHWLHETPDQQIARIADAIKDAVNESRKRKKAQ